MITFRSFPYHNKSSYMFTRLLVMHTQQEACICAFLSFDRYVEVRALINIDTELLSFRDEKITSRMCLRPLDINNFACWAVELFMVIYYWISVMIVENTQTFTELYVNTLFLIHISHSFNFYLNNEYHACLEI